MRSELGVRSSNAIVGASVCAVGLIFGLFAGLLVGEMVVVTSSVEVESRESVEALGVILGATVPTLGLILGATVPILGLILGAMVTILGVILGAIEPLTVAILGVILGVEPLTDVGPIVGSKLGGPGKFKSAVGLGVGSNTIVGLEVGLIVELLLLKTVLSRTIHPTTSRMVNKTAATPYQKYTPNRIPILPI